MGTEIGSLFVKIGLQSQEFRKGVIDSAKRLGQVDTAAKKTGRQFSMLGGTVGKLTTLFGAYMGVRGLLGVTNGFIRAADTAEQYQLRLKILLRSQAEGNRMFSEMTTLASRVPFEYEKIMGSATALAGVMKGGVDEVKQWMPLILDLAATTGLSVEETTGQVIRMYSAGAASADMFRERGVLAMLGFTAGVSYSAEETRKKLMEAWTSADSQFRGATESMADTWSGTTSMLSDAWFSFSAEMGGDITDSLIPLVKLLTDEVNQLADFLKERKQFVWFEKLAKKQDQLAQQQIRLRRAEKRGLWEAWNQYDQNIEILEKEIHTLKNKLGITQAVSDLTIAAKKDSTDKIIGLTKKETAALIKEGKKWAEAEMKELEEVSEAWTKFYFERYKAAEKAYDAIRKEGEQLARAEMSELDDVHDAWVSFDNKIEKDTSDTYKTMHSSLKSAFIEVGKGEIKSFGDFFGAVMDSMLTKAINMFADLAAEWVLAQIFMTNTTGGPSGNWGLSAALAGGGGGGGGGIGIGGPVALGIGGAALGASRGTEGLLNVAGGGGLGYLLATLGPIELASPWTIAAGALLGGIGGLSGIPFIGEVFKPVSNFVENIPIVGDLLSGIFQAGTPFVPQTGPALVHQGERIFSADDNRALIDAINNISGGSGGVTIHVHGNVFDSRRALMDAARKLDPMLRNLNEMRV